MFNNPLTQQAIAHTTHCLIGCGIGEVLGMGIGSVLNWANVPTTILAVVLAFFFGYLLTFRSVRPHTSSTAAAIRVVIPTDTASIASMETVDNVVLWLWPGTFEAEIISWVFWISLAVALAIAFIATVPVNRFLISRGIGPKEHHH